MVKRSRQKLDVPKAYVIYDDGIRRVEYVSRSDNEINAEIRRVAEHIGLARRQLATQIRCPNPILRATVFILDNICPDVTSSSPKELARLSFLMEDALTTLNRMKHTDTDYIRKARFHLQYGQTPKRRERTFNAPGDKKKKAYRDYDSDDFNRNNDDES